MATVPLTPSALGMLARSGLSQAGTSALIDAANRSPYFAGQLNEAAAKNVVISVDPNSAGRGTSYDKTTNTISIDPTWQPRSGSSVQEQPDTFATTIAHELGHAVSPGGSGAFGGSGPSGALRSPTEAVRSGRINEGVAWSSKFIVATQLGAPMHSDPRGLVTPKLLDAANQNCLNIPEITFGSAVANAFISPTGEAVTEAGRWNGVNSKTSTAPRLNYDEFNANWWVISKCFNAADRQLISPRDVDWSSVPAGPIETALNYTPTTSNTAAGWCTYTVPGLKLRDGRTVSLTGEVNEDGVLTAASVTSDTPNANSINADGTTTSTTSTTDGEFIRTVHTVTFGTDGKILTEQHYAINTLDNIKIPLNADGTYITPPAATTQPATPEVSTEASTTTTASGSTTPVTTTSEQNQPVARVPTAQPATENVAPVASTANATSTSNATTDSQTTITAPAGLTPAELAELNTIGGGLGAVSSIFSLRNWDKMDDLGHLGAVVGTYNAFANLGQSGGSTVPSTMGQIGAGLGLLSAVGSGDSLGIASSGAAFYNSFYGGTSSAIPMPAIAFLGMANAIEHDDPSRLPTVRYDFEAHMGWTEFACIDRSIAGKVAANSKWRLVA